MESEEVCPSVVCSILALAIIILPALLRMQKYRLTFRGQFRKHQTITFKTIEVKIQNDVTLTIFDKEDHEVKVFKAIIGRSIPPYVTYAVSMNDDRLDITWGDYAQFSVIYCEKQNGVLQYNVEWKVYNYTLSFLEENIKLAGGHWYGLGHVWNQPWPLERWDCQMVANVTGEIDPPRVGEQYGAIQERILLTSTGLVLVVDFDCPLFTSLNHDCDNTLMLQAQYRKPYSNSDGKDLSLRYTILQTDDTREAYLGAAGTLFRKPNDIPDEQMFRYPVWSTWAQYKQGIDQEKVINFAHDIRKHGFKDAQLEIDDDWTPAYGDWCFDESKFPDPEAMVKKLKELGFRVTIWTHPFGNVNSEAFADGRLWVKDASTGKPAIVTWWNGKAALLDVTNPDAVAWFQGNMRHLQTRYGFDSFKIDAGEGHYLPWNRKTNVIMDNPNMYTKLFVEMCYQLDTKLRAQEVRVGTGAQHLPMFFRLQDKDSRWSVVNGLKTVIPNVLNQGLLGYPFVLPDMIGGNAYAWMGFSKSMYPDKELYIRWMEVNALMPAMQISVVPWHYDDEVIRIARKMCDLHEMYSDLIIHLAKEATITGAPICRPLWWIAPKDETALTLSTEFLLGNDLLVAPVLDKGATSRDIYLPQGQWKDELRDQFIKGPKWLKGYQAELDELPHFFRVQEI